MTNRGIDFELLSHKDALDLAVLLEEETRDRYIALAGQLRMHQTASAALFFETMARIEDVHRAGLLASRLALYADAPRKVTREMLTGIDEPRGEDPRVPMTLRQALEAALRAEEKAREFFERALVVVKNPEVGQLFALLREEEIDHRRMVFAELAHVAPELPLPA